MLKRTLQLVLPVFLIACAGGGGSSVPAAASAVDRVAAVGASASPTGTAAGALAKYSAICPSPGTVENTPSSVALSAACRAADSLRLPMVFAFPLIEAETASTARSRTVGAIKDCQPRVATGALLHEKCVEMEVEFALFKNSQGSWVASDFSAFRQSRESLSVEATARARESADAEAAKRAACVLQVSDVASAGLPVAGLVLSPDNNCGIFLVVESTQPGATSRTTPRVEYTSGERRDLDSWATGVGNMVTAGGRFGATYATRPLPEFGEALLLTTAGSSGVPGSFWFFAQKGPRSLSLHCAFADMEAPCRALFRALYDRAK